MEGISNFLERNSGKIILTTVIITLLLIIPLLTMGSDEQASSDPEGEVFDLMDEVNNRFAPRVYGWGYIAESLTGDILTQASLSELYRNEQELREEDQRGALAPENLPTQSYLYESFDLTANQSFLGVYSLADAVQDTLINDPRFNKTLETATDEDVKLAIHQLFSNPTTSDMKEFLSVKVRSEKRVINGLDIDYWVSPALVLNVLADNEKLGGGTFEIGMGGGDTVLDKEEFNRNVQRILRGDEQTYHLWGIAIDVNLEGADEGQTAGYFIMFTVIAVVLVAGLSLRSYWAVALTGAGLGSLIIWLKGISNLAGLKGGLVVDLIVPIAMISLGVDFAIHALRRYQEEKSRNYIPRMALRAGFAGVLGALVLAMASDSIAFISNTSSGIESVFQFGIAATIAVVSSFFVLGIVLPLLMKHIDNLQNQTSNKPSKRKYLKEIFNSMGVAALTGTGVIFLVAVSKPLGIAILLTTIVGSLLIPLLIMRRRQPHNRQVPDYTQIEANTSSHGAISDWLVILITWIARYRIVVLLVIVGITIVATLFAFRLDATFDVKDFFDNKSDFVISLDKLEEHLGETGGEPGIIYIKGDLANPLMLVAIDQLIAELGDNPNIAKGPEGEVELHSRTVVDLLRYITGNNYALNLVTAATGVLITDVDSDGLPDSQEQINAVYSFMLTNGIPHDENTLIFTPGQIHEVLFYDPNTKDGATILMVGIPGTREQQNVITAHDSISDNLKVLSEKPTITSAGLTGSPFTRLAQLDATTKTLQKSLPIAAAAIFVLLLIIMRSFRYAVVTIIPIGLVVAWLYGLMYLTGFALNYVTATIGAVSLGVGIDYSIHMTERFREEMQRTSDKMQALRQATSGTGVALLASAASSIIGFAILGFAPMPMFSSYGILTALMIFLSLSASLVVLPSLLLLVTHKNVGKNKDKSQ